MKKAHRGLEGSWLVQSKERGGVVSSLWYSDSVGRCWDTTSAEVQ